jgi:predicted nuclease of predicted toxin-antitoxin system
MRILADENVDAGIVEWLRAQGEDVVWIAEVDASVSDEEVIRRANVEERLLVTCDKDFGEMVYRQRLAATGVVLIRLRASTEASRISVVSRHWPIVQDRAIGSFLVLRDDRVRVRPLSESGS